MTEATVRELRNQGGRVRDRVVAGERVTITRDGESVASGFTFGCGATFHTGVIA